MKCYRTATHQDYEDILRLLLGGDEQGVLVRRLNFFGEGPFPLLEISQGPYALTSDGIAGFSSDGEKCFVRIVDNPLHNVELKRGDGEWVSCEMSSVILLIPE